eukprot:UN23820
MEHFTLINHLDLYLNTFPTIPDLKFCAKNLTWLDLSFNGLRKIENLECLDNLTDLFLVNNKIKKIENVNHLKKLNQIELGGNRIRKIENLGGLNIHSLWLGKINQQKWMVFPI